MPHKEEKKKEKKEPNTAHREPVQKVLDGLKVTQASGLSTEEVDSRLAKYGYNELDPEEKESIWDKIKEQFQDLLVRILLASAVISFIISSISHGEHENLPPWVEPLVIFVILIANATVGILQDLDAEKALDALKKIQSIHSKVLRNGQWTEIESKNLVPGDIVKVSQGDKIPADIRLLELLSTTIRVDQSILTGETDAVAKEVEPVSHDTVLEKKNMVFSGTLVTNGSAIGVVASTGMNTEFGNIHQQIMEAKSDKADDSTPLKKKLDAFGESLAKAIGIICVVIWIINFRNFSDPIHGSTFKGALYYFKIAVALAVAAIPEGLPAVITTCLALGTRRMAKNKAIIRKLASVETLGCTQVICSDKTGTLTQNKMVVKELFIFGLRKEDIVHSHVDGETYEASSGVEIKSDELCKMIKTNAPNVEKLAGICSLNNDAQIVNKEDGIVCSGLPTEGALRVLVEKMGKVTGITDSHPEAYNKKVAEKYYKKATLEFTRERKSMSTLVRYGTDTSGAELLYIKGAPDYLLEKCSKVLLADSKVTDLSVNDKKEIAKRINAMAATGLRTLAICYKQDVGVLKGYNGIHDTKHECHKLLQKTENYASLENEPILVGVVGIKDPARKEVPAAIQQCKQAGVNVVMITGDIKETGAFIAKEVGIISEIRENNCFTGKELDEMSDQKKEELLMGAMNKHEGLVFARTEPKHKRELVRIFRKLNIIVAMTGDGVNDAPALQQADIGIAMGIAGTEVAKEASAMVLADDNFATIVKAVSEGRAIFANMKAFIRYMISSNIGEVVSIFLTSVTGIPDGFNSIQLLWVNLVTDGFPATALSFNPSDPDIMLKPPRNQEDGIITPWIFFRYTVIGSYVGIATVGIFIYWYTSYNWAGDGHTLISYNILRNWSECPGWGPSFEIIGVGKGVEACNYFLDGKAKASTLSLTVLVMIEMFNAINSLSEEQSLLTIGLFSNPLLIGACCLSVALHCLIIYVPFLANIFSVTSLSCNDWILVMIWSAPVFVLDEMLKVLARQRTRKSLEKYRSH